MNIQSVPSRPPQRNRPYRQRARAQQTAATRAAIRAAATALFVEQGYLATTVGQVATGAGVAERTVYAVFPGKSALFRHCLDIAVRGSEDPTPVAQAPETLRHLADPDPRRALAGAVHAGADLLDRAGDLIMVSVEAAGADPDMRAAADAGARETHANQLALARHLAELGALRPGMGTDLAADILYALASPYLHQLLRRHRGWSTERYRSWLLADLRAQLLGD